MATYNAYRALLADPLCVTALIHCGQFRDLDQTHGINELTKIYRIEPFIRGYLHVTWRIEEERWVVESTLGSDFTGVPLVNSGHLLDFIAAAQTWTQMEVALATYFCCNVYEFHGRSPQQRRLKASPRLADD